ncbi:hypothetical protein ACFL0I_05190, partial [Gemmatimonadota bacterium]
AYPSNTTLYLDVDWRVPKALVEYENTNIIVSARSPWVDIFQDRFEEFLNGWDWVWPWFLGVSQRADLFTVPMVLFIFMTVLYARRVGSVSGEARSAALFLMPPMVGLLLWLATAPSPRFAGGVFWLLGAGMTAIYFQQAASKTVRQKLVRFSLGFIASTTLLTIAVSAVFSQSRYGWTFFVPPGPEQGFHPLPEVEVVDFVTDSGLVINKPVRVLNPTSDWMPSAFCWSAPLPCTGQPKKALEMRDPRDMSRGFRDPSRRLPHPGPGQAPGL